ncbi:hypothetical protein ACEWY4_001959 [Coilia grayii]|uniref:Ig-like domain-containing protein n=1 Tax=Coilia grayii TaxID=363190 RepID=A0ABD1KUF7_9TELE
MVEWDTTSGVSSEYVPFKGRTIINTNTGDVTIVNLAKDDSGLYQAEIRIPGMLPLTNVTREIKVIDPVTEAMITCQANATMATLHCAAAGDSLMYSWSGPGLQTAGMRGQTGPQISQENQDSVYTCEVTNPVSNSSVSFRASICFDSGNPLITVFVLLGVLAVAAAVAAGFWCHHHRNKTKEPSAGNENNTTETEHWISNPRDNSIFSKSHDQNFTLSRTVQDNPGGPHISLESQAHPLLAGETTCETSKSSLNEGTVSVNNKSIFFTGGFTSFISVKKKSPANFPFSTTDDKPTDDDNTEMTVDEGSTHEKCETLNLTCETSNSS